MFQYIETDRFVMGGGSLTGGPSMIRSARSEGIQSFKDDRPTSSCPYSSGSTRQIEWTTGWTAQQILARAADAEPSL